MYRIGITGVGGGVGQSIIKALKHSDYEVIGMDGDDLGTGLYTVNKAYRIPYASHPNFINRLLEICADNKIDLLFPGLDAELNILSKNSDLFKKIGTTVVVSSPDVIETAENKFSTFKNLTELGFNVPFTQKATDLIVKLSYPFIIKPYLGGARSKDVFLVKNKEQYISVIANIGNRINDFILQEYLEGEEYTCGSVTLGGKCYGSIVMRRELRSGDTYKCFSEENTIIQDYLINLMNALQPFGACNAQLKLKDGVPYIFEINARCSGTTAARALCGFNEPQMVSDFLLKSMEPKFKIESKTILRYWNEVSVQNESVDALRQTGFLEQNSEKKL